MTALLMEQFLSGVRDGSAPTIKLTHHLDDARLDITAEVVGHTVGDQVGGFFHSVSLVAAIFPGWANPPGFRKSDNLPPFQYAFVMASLGSLAVANGTLCLAGLMSSRVPTRPAGSFAEPVTRRWSLTGYLFC
jgi:hypothetical protein